MARKQTNLSVAADVETADDMLALADAVGPHVAVLKTHVDVFSTWTEEHAAKLKELSEKHGETFFKGRKNIPFNGYYKFSLLDTRLINK